MAEVTNDNVVPISGITAQMLTAQSKSQSTDVDLIDFKLDMASSHYIFY